MLKYFQYVGTYVHMYARMCRCVNTAVYSMCVQHSSVEAMRKVACNVVLSEPLLCRPQACSGGPLLQHSEGKGAEKKVGGSSNAVQGLLLPSLHITIAAN